MLVPTETDPNQPVTALWTTSVNNHQLHGPTAHPSWKFVYFTDWTDNTIRVVDVDKDELAAVDPIRDGTLTRQLHRGLLQSEWHTRSSAWLLLRHEPGDPFQGKRAGRQPHGGQGHPPDGERKNKEYAAFTHFVTWLDNRRPITSSQQTGNTSLTPTGWKVIGPSVWLIDAVEGKGKMIIGPARSKSPDDRSGIYKPASDVAVVGKKLYVGEEDSMDRTIDNAGYISIWDITDILISYIQGAAPAGRTGAARGFPVGAHAVPHS